MGILLDGGPYYPDLASSACYVAPAIAVVSGWMLVRRRRPGAALVIASMSAFFVAVRVPVALAHPRYYNDEKDWVIVGFAALFPFYCIIKYMVGRGEEPNAPPEAMR